VLKIITLKITSVENCIYYKAPSLLPFKDVMIVPKKTYASKYEHFGNEHIYKQLCNSGNAGTQNIFYNYVCRWLETTT